MENYEWPESLHPLRDWLKRKGVDVLAIKTERQALFFAKSLGNQKLKLPKDRRKPLFPLMLKMQEALCPKMMMSARKGDYERHRDRNLGTFGPASTVRKISPDEYEKLKRGD